ncbi:hypothetical protein ENUP19_0378G0021 [Entamoeba nuttalli]|uniref:Uncharacterized protein n=1 Tax=Entamoeba nuttalli TaxID=412467 RepID=A0ABQ0DZ81_9EUKA
MKVLLVFCVLLAVNAEDRFVNHRVHRFINGRWFEKYSRKHQNNVRALYTQLKQTVKMIRKIERTMANKPINEKKGMMKQLVVLRKQAAEIRRALAEQIRSIRKIRRTQRKRLRRQRRVAGKTVRRHLRQLMKDLRRQYRNKPREFYQQFKSQSRKVFNMRKCQKFHKLCKKIIRRFNHKARRVQSKLERVIQLRKHISTVAKKKVSKAVKSSLYHFEKHYKSMDKNHAMIKNAFMQTKCK